MLLKRVCALCTDLFFAWIGSKLAYIVGIPYIYPVLGLPIFARLAFWAWLVYDGRDKIQVLTPSYPTGNIVDIYLSPVHMLDYIRGRVMMLGSPYPDVVKIYFGFKPIIFTCSSKSVRAVLKEQKECYEMGRFFKNLYKFIPFIVVAETEEWRPQRTAMEPAFRSSNLKAIADTIVIEKGRTLLKKIEEAKNGQIKNLWGLLTDTMLEIMVQAFFGYDLSYMTHLTTVDRKVNSCGRALQYISDNTVYLAFPGAMLYIPLTNGYARAIKDLREVVDDILKSFTENKQNKTKPGGSLLELMMQSKNMTQQAVRDNVLGFIIVGNETTATFFSWILVMLAKHPNVQKRVFVEVETTFGRNRDPLKDDLEKLVYLKQVIKEVGRMRPAVLAVDRKAKIDTTIMHHPIYKGRVVVFSPYLVNYDPNEWENAEEFNPDRWTDGLNRDKCAYATFGAGPRACIGERMAFDILVIFTVSPPHTHIFFFC